MSRWPTLLLVLLLAAPASAQDPLEQAVDAARAFRWEQAAGLLATLAEQVSTSEEPGRAALIFLLQGDVHEAQGQLLEALYKRGAGLDAARISRQATLVATATNELGRTYLARGDTREASRLLNEALSLARRVNSAALTARVLTNLGNLAFALKRYPEAEKRYREALELLPQDEAGQRARAGLLTNLGNLALRRHHPRQADALYRQARQTAHSAGDELSEAKILLNLGAAAEQQGNYQTAFDLYQAAGDRFARMGTVTGQAQAALNVALLHQRLGGYEQALEGIRLALVDLRRSQAELPAEWEATMALNRAPLHRFLGQPEIAERVLREVLEQHRDRLSGAELAALHGQLAALAAAEGKLESGRQHYVTALNLVGEKGQRAWLLLGRADLERRQGDGAAAQALYTRARELASDARRPNDEVLWRAEFGLGLLARKTGNPEGALAHYQAALGRLEQVRSRLTAEELTTSFGEDKHPLYEEVIDLLLELGKPEEAFLASEQGRARALLEILRRGDVTSIDSPGPVDLKSIQASLPADALLLSYYTTPDKTFLFVLGRERFEALTLALGRAALEESVSKLRPAQDGSAVPFSEEAAATLYQTLVAPAQVKAGTRLVVLPDGPLYYLPFALLRGPGGYLIEAHPVTYGASASVLAQQPSPSKGGGPALVYAAPSATGSGEATERSGPLRFSRASFSPLPGAESEAREVAQRHPASNVRVGRHCLETRFYQEAGSHQHDILHFATHGFADDRNPMLSGLLMSPEEEPQDGFLLARELVELELPARLAVLSACSTGLGRLSGGEGMLGLTRSFQIAGVPQVVASLWPVSDRGTRELMAGFHTALAAGEASTARALQRAQVAMLKTEEPRIWAPFILVGRDW